MGDREGGQKRREGIMAQLLNRLRAEERIAGGEFWHSPERCGWLLKQGEHIKTWRRRWFILKQGRMFWFKEHRVSSRSVTRGIIRIKEIMEVKAVDKARGYAPN